MGGEKIVKNKSNGHVDRNERDAGCIRLKRTRYLTIALTVCLGQPISGVAQEVASGLLTTNSPFVLYLNNPPWIKEMRFIQNAHWMAGKTLQSINRQGWANLTNRVAIQPSGMYFESLSGSPGGPPWTNNQRLIQGTSDHYYWNAGINEAGEGVLSLSSRRPEDGAFKDNLSSRVMRIREHELDRVRYFGLPALATNSFILVNQDRFEAHTTDGFAINGNIVTASNNRPITLSYSIGDSGADVFAVKYSYDPSQKLPIYIERQDLRNGHPYGDTITNRIEYADYETDESITNGYMPKMFFTNLAVFTQILVESNGLRYVIGQNGKHHLVDESLPRPLPEKGGGKVTFFVIIVFLATSGLFILRVRQRNQKL